MPDEPPVGKPFWESKTFWTNVVALTAGIAKRDVVTIVTAAANILLRFVTKEPVTLGTQPEN